MTRSWLIAKERPSFAQPGRGGSRYLPGYGFRMSYPDEATWLMQFREIFCEDCYGVRKLGRGAAVLDVGANIGTFAACVKSRRPDAAVVCVEPDVANLEYLRRNVGSFTGPDVTIIPAAVGPRAGLGEMKGAQSDSMQVENGGAGNVRIVTLPEIVGGGHVDLLKMDIEGAEFEVLESVGDSLKRVARLVMEYHDYEHVPSRLVGILDVLKTGGFDRFSVWKNYSYVNRPDRLVHSCLVEAWRAMDENRE